MYGRLITTWSFPIKTIAIVGNGLTRDDAPFGDRSIDIYTTGSVATAVTRVSRVFDVHINGVQTDDVLNGFDCTVYLKRRKDSVPNSVTFPIEVYESEFGYIFNCSMTMILAHAIAQDPDRIEVYGVDFAEGYEPEYRVTFVYLLGLARGRGIDVYIEPGSLVFGDYRTYQYDAVPPGVKKIEKTIGEWKGRIEANKAETDYLRGAVDAASTCLAFLGGK